MINMYKYIKLSLSSKRTRVFYLLNEFYLPILHNINEVYPQFTFLLTSEGKLEVLENEKKLASISPRKNGLEASISVYRYDDSYNLVKCIEDLLGKNSVLVSIKYDLLMRKKPRLKLLK